jgi:hypothetical protein
MTESGAYVLLLLIFAVSLFSYYLSWVAVNSGCEHDIRTGNRIRLMIFPVGGLLSTLIIVLTLY